MTSSMDLEARFCARNYHPLPVTRVRGRRRVVDLQIDRAPRQIRAGLEQADRLHLAS